MCAIFSDNENGLVGNYTAPVHFEAGSSEIAVSAATAFFSFRRILLSMAFRHVEQVTPWA